MNNEDRIIGGALLLVASEIQFYHIEIPSHSILKLIVE